MRRLRKLGCNIALDDFGTGFPRWPICARCRSSMLKIDGSFVRDVLNDPRAESMVQAIAQLARAMSLTTVAEYVETERSARASPLWASTTVRDLPSPGPCRSMICWRSSPDPGMPRRRSRALGPRVGLLTQRDLVAGGRAAIDRQGTP